MKKLKNTGKSYRLMYNKYVNNISLSEITKRIRNNYDTLSKRSNALRKVTAAAQTGQPLARHCARSRA
jgi:hypothetical protein